MLLVSINEQLLQSWEPLLVFRKHLVDALSEENLWLLENHLFERHSPEVADVTCVVDELLEHHPLLRHEKLLCIKNDDNIASSRIIVLVCWLVLSGQEPGCQVANSSVDLRERLLPFFRR